MTKRKIEYWVIPPDADGEFVANMEEVLETYEKAYDPDCPVVCMDEQPVQLIGETRVPIPATKEHPERVDYEYERKGTASIFMFAEPLSGFRQATGRPRRTKDDWAHEVAHLLDSRYADVRADHAGLRQFEHAHQGRVLRSVSARAGPRLREKDRLRVHSQAWELAERGGVRIELHDQPMLEGPTDRRPRDAANRNCRLVNPRQREATSRRLAIHHRQSKGQVEAALPQDLVWTGH